MCSAPVCGSCSLCGCVLFPCHRARGGTACTRAAPPHPRGWPECSSPASEESLRPVPGPESKAAVRKRPFASLPTHTARPAYGQAGTPAWLWPSHVAAARALRQTAPGQGPAWDRRGEEGQVPAPSFHLPVVAGESSRVLGQGKHLPGCAHSARCCSLRRPLQHPRRPVPPLKHTALFPYPSVPGPSATKPILGMLALCCAR